MTAVTPSDRVGSLWVIDQGLKPGDKVVVEGLQRLRDSMTGEGEGRDSRQRAQQKAAEGLTPSRPRSRKPWRSSSSIARSWRWSFPSS